LGVSERTVWKHLQGCNRKLGLANRSHAAAFNWAISSDEPGGLPRDAVG